MDHVRVVEQFIESFSDRGRLRFGEWLWLMLKE
jgi:hypothetical protein